MYGIIKDKDKQTGDNMMKKFLSILTIMTLAIGSVYAANLDGDTYRAERAAVEKMTSSGYIAGRADTNVQNVNVQNQDQSKRKWFRRKSYKAPDMKQYYDFGGFHEYKGYNGQ